MPFMLCSDILYLSYLAAVHSLLKQVRYVFIEQSCAGANPSGGKERVNWYNGILNSFYSANFA